MFLYKYIFIIIYEPNRRRNEYEEESKKLQSEWIAYDEGLKADNDKNEIFNIEEFEEIQKLFLITKSNSNVKLGIAQKLANDLSSRFASLLKVIIKSCDNSSKLREKLTTIKREQSKMLEDIKSMKIEDMKRLSKDIEYVHEIIIDEYDKDTTEKIQSSNDQDQSIFSDSKQKAKLESALSSCIEK